MTAVRQGYAGSFVWNQHTTCSKCRRAALRVCESFGCSLPEAAVDVRLAGVLLLGSFG